jgi:predicted aspartyl protease
VTFPFNRLRGLIHVQAELTGPAGTVNLVLALDTGASATLIRTTRLVQAGYDPSAVGTPVKTTTAGGVVQSLRLPVLSLTALGQTRANMAVLARDLPPTASAEGLLGLDFLRSNVLTIDFLKGEITLTLGAPAGATP